MTFWGTNDWRNVNYKRFYDTTLLKTFPPKELKKIMKYVCIKCTFQFLNIKQHRILYLCHHLWNSLWKSWLFHINTNTCNKLSDKESTRWILHICIYCQIRHIIASLNAPKAIVSVKEHPSSRCRESRWIKYILHNVYSSFRHYSGIVCNLRHHEEVYFLTDNVLRM